jgi:large subunit ribosomal protein L10
MNKDEKQAEISGLQESFSKAQIALLADYRGLTVAEITELRKALKGAGSVGRVVKNTLAKISAKQALKDSGDSEIEKFLALLNGPNMVVFSEGDPVASAKVLTQFAKEHEKLSLTGAWFEGECIDVKGVEALSSLPSREELLGKLLALINAPATQLVRLLQAPSTQVVRVLDAYRAKLEGK